MFATLRNILVNPEQLWGLLLHLKHVFALEGWGLNSLKQFGLVFFSHAFLFSKALC